MIVDFLKNINVAVATIGAFIAIVPIGGKVYELVTKEPVEKFFHDRVPKTEFKCTFFCIWIHRIGYA